ncbi:MAG: hypothetical protein V4719_02345, partial [Planctomycetota bacterium]
MTESRMNNGVWLALCLCPLLAWGATANARAADKLELSESSTEKRSFNVAIRMDLDGQVQAAIGDTKAVAMKLAGNAQLMFHERRLASLGRDAADFRGLRIYNQAEFHSQVADRTSETKLRPEFRQVVAEGQIDGVRLYSPFGPLTYDELELLRPPV